MTHLSNPMYCALLHEKARAPERSSREAAGYDLYAVEDVSIPPGEVVKVSTGVAIQLQKGTCGFIKPRSSLAAKYGIDVLGGVIDSDYRGEILALLINHGKLTLDIRAGDRIAQLVVLIHSDIVFPVVRHEDLSKTSRGSGGFGSTGK